MNNTVSIIMPTYNSKEFILDSIRSVQMQTYTDWELLITDDCSSDNTREIIQDLADVDQRIRLFQCAENGGAGIARNLSIKKAIGRYIAFCDSDDQWREEKLDKQISFMTEHDLAFSYGSYEKIDDDGVPIGVVTCLPRVSYNKMLKNNYVGCLTAMYDTKKVGKVFMPEIRKRQDWALWLDLLKRCGEARGIVQPLAIYRSRSGSISSNKLEMIKYNWIIFHDIEKLGLLRSSWCMIAFMWQYCLKKVVGK